MRIATFTADGRQQYGAVAKGGVIALSDDFPHWATLRDVIAAQGSSDLAGAARGRAVTHRDGSFCWDIPVPNRPPLSRGKGRRGQRPSAERLA